MKKIKQLFLVVFICALTISLTGCKSSNLDGTLEEIMESVYSDVYTGLSDDEKPMLGNINVSEDMQDNIAYYIGTEDIEYEEILASEPMMGSIAHSVVLVRMKENADIEAAKKAIKENIDPRKWICVEVPEDKVIVESKGNVIILIMVADDTTREKLKEGFDNL